MEDPQRYAMAMVAMAMHRQVTNRISALKHFWNIWKNEENNGKHQKNWRKIEETYDKQTTSPMSLDSTTRQDFTMTSPFSICFRSLPVRSCLSYLARVLMSRFTGLQTRGRYLGTTERGVEPRPPLPQQMEATQFTLRSTPTR